MDTGGGGHGAGMFAWCDEAPGLGKPAPLARRARLHSLEHPGPRGFTTGGGYGEMSVVGLSVECDDISVGGEPYVFSRVPYCAMDCFEHPNAAHCVGCGQAGSGSF